MGINKTLFTGVAGLNAHGEALGVVGDNIANVNTTGYKAERALFSDLLGRSMMAMDQPGSGVQLTKITRVFAQGTLLTTDSPTDLALNGQGFFVVSGQVAGRSGNFFTRAGQFTLDNGGTLVSPNGMPLQGYLITPTGELNNQLGDMRIASAVLPPAVTENIEVSANLNATETIPAAFDPATPGTTSNFSTAITVYDSLGNSHRVDVYFRKSVEAVAGNTWTWHALVDGGELTGGTAGTAVQCANGTVEFDPSGRLVNQTQAASDFDFLNAVQSQVIDFNFGDDLTAGGTGLTGTTQYAADNTIRSQEQDGYSTGELAGVGVEANGQVSAVYSNGEQRVVGQIAIATFRAEGELARAGDNLWAQTQGSGDARIGFASTGSAGAITAGALEQSTVDLATEFVNMISYQRGFQANSRTITTADQLYQEVVNLKR
jgi:flagellar hook protein FlgE